VKVHCPYCDRPAELVTGAAIYPHRADLLGKKFWRCESCGAHVGCHDAGKNGDGTVPLGRLANAELRRWKQRAHAAFDPLWKARHMSRRAAYAWLADQLGISVANCHVGMFDVDACKAVVAAVGNRRLSAGVEQGASHA
jgi:hypothetical protein